VSAGAQSVTSFAMKQSLALALFSRWVLSATKATYNVHMSTVFIGVAVVNFVESLRVLVFYSVLKSRG